MLVSREDQRSCADPRLQAAGTNWFGRCSCKAAHHGLAGGFWRGFRSLWPPNFKQAVTKPSQALKRHCVRTCVEQRLHETEAV